MCASSSVYANLFEDFFNDCLEGRKEVQARVWSDLIKKKMDLHGEKRIERFSQL